MGRPERIEDEELLNIVCVVLVLHGAQWLDPRDRPAGGNSQAALFKRYPTKVALFLAAMMPPNVDVDALIAVAEAISDPRQSLIVLCERMLDYFRESNPDHPAADPEPADRPRGGAPPLRRQPQRLASAVPAYLARQAERGRIVCSDPGGAALLLISAVHSLVLFEIIDLHAQRDAQTAVRAIVNALWEGLKPGAKSDD